MNSAMVLLLLGGLVVAVLLTLLAKKRKKSGPAARDPLAEAEVFLAYGRKREAKAVLESHLRASPNDEKVMQLLRRCQ